MENSTDSTVCSQTVLLEVDTGADVHLINKHTFDQLFGKARDLLQLTPIRMGELWKYSSESAGKVPCISTLGGQGLQASFLCY